MIKRKGIAYWNNRKPLDTSSKFAKLVAERRLKDKLKREQDENNNKQNN